MNLSDLITDQTAAILPAPILWAAAQFASKDEGRLALTSIQIQRHDSGAVTVRSCDGHRAFRITLTIEHAHSSAAELKVSAADWSKPGRLLTAAQWIQIKTDGTAAAIAHDGSIAELRTWKENPYQFPNLDQCWPTEYDCEPGAIITTDANYLLSFATVAAELSPKAHITLETSQPNQPLQLTANCRDYGAKLEFLLMPVQIRDNPHPSIEAKRERERQRRADARELETYRAAAATKLPTLQTVAA